MERWQEVRLDILSRTVYGAEMHLEHACKRIAELERERDELRERLDRAEERIRAWTDGYDPPALEDDDAIGPLDIQELVEAAPRFRGDREGGPHAIELEVYEAVVSRSEIVAYGRALAWQQRRIAALEHERDELLAVVREVVYQTDDENGPGNVEYFVEPAREIVGRLARTGGDEDAESDE